jgi:hypothetical protein
MVTCFWEGLVFRWNAESDTLEPNGKIYNSAELARYARFIQGLVDLGEEEMAVCMPGVRNGCAGDHSK